MANTKITGLTAYTAPVAGTDVIPVVDVANGITKKITLANASRGMFAIVEAAGFALQTAAGVQSAFPADKDTWTLKANTTYFIEGMYWIQEATNSVTVAMAFAGSATITSILYEAWGLNAAANTTTTTPQMTIVNQVASTVVNATGTTNKAIKFQGILRTNAAGTFIPQINFSGTAAGTPTMLANSYIRFQEVGTDTENIVGTVA